MLRGSRACVRSIAIPAAAARSIARRSPTPRTAWARRCRSRSPDGGPSGIPGLPVAAVGFAVAAPVLRMQEGERKVTLSLQFGDRDARLHTPKALAGSFQAFLTGEKRWLGPYGLLPAETGGMSLAFMVPESD